MLHDNKQLQRWWTNQAQLRCIRKQAPPGHHDALLYIVFLLNTLHLQGTNSKYTEMRTMHPTIIGLWCHHKYYILRTHVYLWCHLLTRVKDSRTSLVLHSTLLGGNYFDFYLLLNKLSFLFQHFSGVPQFLNGDLRRGLYLCLPTKYSC